MQLKPNSAMLLRHQPLERETCEITNYCQSPFHTVNQKEHLTSSVSPKIFLLSECPRITHSHLMSLIISGLQINKYMYKLINNSAFGMSACWITFWIQILGQTPHWLNARWTHWLNYSQLPLGQTRSGPAPTVHLRKVSTLMRCPLRRCLLSSWLYFKWPGKSDIQY